MLVERPTWVLEISGHTDDVGNADKNMVLSKKRAESVKRFLISKGVDESKLTIKFLEKQTLSQITKQLRDVRKTDVSKWKLSSNKPKKKQAINQAGISFPAWFFFDL